MIKRKFDENYEKEMDLILIREYSELTKLKEIIKNLLIKIQNQNIKIEKLEENLI